MFGTIPGWVFLILINFVALASLIATIFAADDLPQVMTAPNSIALQQGARKLSLTLKELKAKLPVQRVTLWDPVYKTEKTYDAFLLDSVLKLLMPPASDLISPTQNPAKVDTDEIVFEGKDGYAPTLSISKKKDHVGYLAFQEHDRKDGKRWEQFDQGKEKMTPAPYYVLWKDGKNLAEDFPWPYQLVKIELVNFKEKYSEIYPEKASKNSLEMNGFQTFKTDCLRCHTLNLIGGGIGPELNTPKNILEYWDIKTVRAFIKNPGNFRAKDKMPPFPQLSDEKLDELFAYLNYMKNSKKSY